MSEEPNTPTDRKSCCGMAGEAKNAILAKKMPIMAGVTVAVVTIVAAYLLWCPESPRFDNKPWRREWWQRQRYHATH
jgi:hypothetical protein